MGSVVPMCNSLQLAWGDHCFRDCCYLRWCFCLHDGDRCWNWGRRDWPVLLGFKQVLWIDSALGQGVPCLTGALGMSSKGGGFWIEGCLPFWGLALGLDTSRNCPVASLCIVTSMAVAANSVVCVWVDVVAVVGAVVVVGMGWFRTLTLYPLLAITVLFLLSLAFRVGARLDWSWLCLLWTVLCWMGLG